MYAATATTSAWVKQAGQSSDAILQRGLLEGERGRGVNLQQAQKLDGPRNGLQYE